MSMLTPQAIAEGFLQQHETVGLNEAVKQLASLILEHRLHSQIERILLCVEDQYQKQYGVVEATATVAHPLSSQLKTKLEALVANKTDAKTVVLQEELDVSVIGGVKVTTNKATFDFTLRSKLDRLQT